MDLKKFYKEVKCGDAAEVFASVRRVGAGGYDGANGPGAKHFLLESRDVSHIYGRLSLIGVDPVLEIRGKNDAYEIEILNERGQAFAGLVGLDLKGKIEKEEGEIEEGARTRRRNVAEVIRKYLEAVKIERREFVGLYGAFSYDLVRLFEDLPDVHEDNGVQDFRLCLYDTFIYFDHLREKAEIIAYRCDSESGEAAVEAVFAAFDEDGGVGEFAVEGAEFDLGKEEFMGLVENARDLARKGELFEINYSNTLRADFKGEPFALYYKYRDVNPSPYLFYFNFADEQLIGASPEMMVRCEDGRVHMRPISGTAARGKDPVEDHENMLALLSSEKERAELDMLIDLGRNDLARICEPGIEISDYRFVEKYSKVMHTVAHVSGVLKSEFDALDALIACLNAGTLTGAPKVAAMVEIEKNENCRRDYYGGVIGYLTFSGEMDTGIIIRAAHIRDGRLSFRVGASMLYDSKPENEYQEILNKAEAFLTTIK